MAPRLLSIPARAICACCCAARGDGGDGGDGEEEASPKSPGASLDGPGLRETLLLAEARLPGGRLSPWQLQWCTDENVGRYLRGRSGNPEKAAVVLAQALEWREEFREVLSGEREPRWQLDLRVLARGDNGVPLMYMCMRFMVPATPETTPHIIEHMAAVLEAAVRARRRGATTMDFVIDCHGLRVSDCLNITPLLALVRMAQQPFRDSLGRAYVVDAPSFVGWLWRCTVKPILPAKTAARVQFVTSAEAVSCIAQSSGSRAAAAVGRVVELNRGEAGCRGTNFPSEVREEAAEVAGQPEALTRALSRAASGLLLGAQAAAAGSKRGCCKRRQRLLEQAFYT